MKIQLLLDSPIISNRVIRFGNWLFQYGRWHWLPLQKSRVITAREHYIRGHEAKKFARMAEEL